MTLQDEIIKQSATIKTDSYTMSIGELLNLYRDNELDIHPEFQRVFRWTNSQKTKLIESILLGIPIPPIFVAQREDGIWDVVDGVQRLSTIFQFIGVLKDEDGIAVAPLVLGATKFLPSLENKSWDGPDAFTQNQKLYVKRAKIDVKIVLKESDEKSKYELFMRLNTGGSVLSPQEVRNCLMIMAYPHLYEWIQDLSRAPDFSHSVEVSEAAKEQQYPMELVTRFLVFRTIDKEALKTVGDIGDFLNDRLEELSKLSPQQKTAEERAFTETFTAIFNAVQDDAFRKYDKNKSRYLGAFSIAGFETIALGVGFNTKPDGSLLPIKNLKERIQSIWDDPTFTRFSGSGMRASTRIPQIVPLGRAIFSP